MKKRIFIAAAVFSAISFGLVSVASEEVVAEEDLTKNNRQEELRERAEQRKQEMIKRAEERKGVRENSIQERKQLAEDRTERVCENIQNRIKTRITRYENNKNAHRNVFSNMMARLERAIDRFKEMGLDTSKLENDVVDLQGRINNLYEVHDSFIEELNETEEFACGKSEGEFRVKLGEARKIAPEVRAAIIEIREYYASVIRKDLLDLRIQLQDIGEKEEENSDEKNEDGEETDDNKDE